MNALFHYSRKSGLLKLRKLLFLNLIIALPFTGIAQCPSPLQSVTYDTAFTGSGNGSNSFTFPRFNGTSGTLMMVEYTTLITLNYTFELENRDNRSINYRVRVNREDEISGSALQSPLFESTQNTYGNYSLRRDDGTPGSGDDYVSIGPMFVLDEFATSSTVYNTADYLGMGDITVDYLSTTYSVVTGSLSHNFNGNASDTVQLGVTYYFCPTTFLASDVVDFTATKVKNDVVLKWSMQNETSGRKYELQKSNNGHTYTTIDKLAANPQMNLVGNYSRRYSVAQGEKGNIVFRVKQIETDGSVKYSSLRIVDLGKVAHDKLRLYPNPSKGAVQLVFSPTVRSDWYVDIIGMNGLVIEKLSFKNALTGRLNFDSKLKPGVYLLKAYNKNSSEVFIERMLIQ